MLGEYKTNCEKNKDWEDRSILNDLFIGNADLSPMCLTLEQFKHYEKEMECYYCDNSTFKITNLTSLIKVLAACHQIDDKYIIENNALDAADYILSATSYCIRDNLSVTGSKALYPVGLIKLLLNGAKDYIDNDERSK